MQAGPKWLFRSHIPSCSESAEIWHVYSFCVKKCPCVFFVFQECRKIWTKLRQIQLYLREIEGGGGGELSRMCLKPSFPACGKRKHRDIFYNKKSRHAKFQPIRSNLENRYEIVTWGRLAQSPSIDMFILHHRWIMHHKFIFNHNRYSIIIKTVGARIGKQQPAMDKGKGLV